MNLLEPPELVLREVCRVCTKENDETKNIFDELNLGDDKSVLIHEFLMTISEIKISNDDELPHKICTQCLNLAQSAYKLQQKCNRSQKILNNQLLAAIKNADVIPPEIETVKKPTPVKNDCDDAMPPKFKTKIKPRSNNFYIGKYTCTKSEVNKRIYECTECNRKCKTLFLFKMHYEAHLEDDYACTVCKKTFKKRQSFNCHLRTHSDKQKDIVRFCEVCGKSFKSLNGFKGHKLMHLGIKQFKCSVCDKRFMTKSCLQVHQKTHSGTKNYLCTVCGKSFISHNGLTKHMATHSLTKPFVCSICGKDFKIRGAMRDHWKKYHVRPEPDESKVYKCNKCEKVFKSNPSLYNHVRTVHGEKKYCCNICNYAFSLRKVLNKHMKGCLKRNS